MKTALQPRGFVDRGADLSVGHSPGHFPARTIPPPGVGVGHFHPTTITVRQSL